MFVITVLLLFWINHAAKGVKGCVAFDSNNKNISVSINGSDADDCCQHGHCLCSSLDKALNCSNNKNDVTIFIYSEAVSLSSTAGISNVSNFILASNGASINCNGGGGIVFASIRNLVINKITWKSCGNSPGAISVYDSLLLINNSNFQNSITRALAIHHSSVYISSDAKSSLFRNNIGGAMYVSNSSLVLDGSFEFYNNFATFGAAIYFTNQSFFSLSNGTQILFISNEATTYGGAIFVDLMTSCDVQQIVIEKGINSSVTFTDNVAGVAGKSWYFELNTSCNFTRNLSDPNSLLYYPSSFDYTNSDFSNQISTTLYQLKLLPPARCISSISNNSCNEYEISGIMLGQEILIPAQALGYYGNIARPTQVLINHLTNTDDDYEYVLAGNNVVLFHNDTLVRGITILSDVSFISNTTLQLTAIGDEMLSINLTVQLSECYPGFESVNISGYLHCKCYQHENIRCTSDSTAMIKYGYWFGKVKGQPTIAYCPQQYCDFTSCDVTTFDYCKLPSYQDGQCRHDRTGPACGRCKPGYVLPFDSPQCVKTDKCSAGITFALMLLNVLYWFLILVVASFIIHLANVIAFAYGIIYFYSVIEFLLELDHWLVFQFVTILSNFAKLTPKFLGTLCVTSDSGWSGIDQQFFHYVHPIAILFILLVVNRCQCCNRIKLCRMIHIIFLRVACLAFVLSYTSLASTSLELLLPITFTNVDGTYIYTSPDQRYFHGRHGFYGTVAIIVTITIIGISVFLLSEPWLSRKFNFIRIKPILDTFQLSYKLKYRHFAAFYLLCRLVILVVYYSINNRYDRSFALQLMCVVIAIIHGYFMPYHENKLNMLDLIILMMTVFVACFNTVLSFTSFHSDDGIVIGVVSTPLVLIFIILFLRMIILWCGNDCNYLYYEDDDFFLEESEGDLPPARSSLLISRQKHHDYMSVNDSIEISRRKFHGYTSVNDSIDLNNDFMINQNHNATTENENIMDMSWR